MASTYIDFSEALNPDGTFDKEKMLIAIQEAREKNPLYRFYKLFAH